MVLRAGFRRKLLYEELKMSKHEPLWKHLQAEGSDTINLTYDEIKAILGFDIDHTFLNVKKEAVEFGYTVGKISMKENTVMFEKFMHEEQKI